MGELLLLPVISEKAVALAEGRHTYTFVVPLSAGKVEIARSIRQRFNVKPVSINSARSQGKATATLVQRGRRRIKGQRSNLKKAYVTLKAGDSISLFEEKKK